MAYGLERHVAHVGDHEAAGARVLEQALAGPLAELLALLAAEIGRAHV